MKVTIIMLFFSFSLAAQVNYGAFDEYVYFINQNKTEYNDIAGSPYVTKDFVPAYINDRKDLVYVRFNIYDNQIEFKKPAGEVVLLSLDEDYRFKILDEKNSEFEIHPYLNNKGKKVKTFFKKLYTTEKFVLYSKQEIKFTPKKIATSGYEKDKQATFTYSGDRFYLKVPSIASETLLTIPQRKKALVDFFDNDAASIKSFIKKEKIKLDNYEDLIKLLTFNFQK